MLLMRTTVGLQSTVSRDATLRYQQRLTCYENSFTRLKSEVNVMEVDESDRVTLNSEDLDKVTPETTGEWVGQSQEELFGRGPTMQARSTDLRATRLSFTEHLMRKGFKNV